MIICAGESLVDVIPTAGGPPRSVPGGGPMNAAIAAARLGQPTAFVGRVSTDEDGHSIWSHLEASNVVLAAAQRGPEPTARAIVETEPVQSFRFEGDGTADASMVEADIGPLGPGPHILHAGTLGIFRGTTADALADLLKGFDGLVSFDPNIRPVVFPSAPEWYEVADRWLDRAHILKASDEDLEWMGADPASLLGRGAAVVLRTVGPDGVEAHLADGTVIEVPGHRVDVADTVGAGDSFSGAVLATLHNWGVRTAASVAALSPAQWRTAIEFGVATAAITVGRLGADPPWLSEVDGLPSMDG
jgi:fructokinase